MNPGKSLTQLTLALAAVLCCCGCEAFLRPYDDLAAGLDGVTLPTVTIANTTGRRTRPTGVAARRPSSRVVRASAEAPAEELPALEAAVVDEPPRNNAPIARQQPARAACPAEPVTCIGCGCPVLDQACCVESLCASCRARLASCKLLQQPPEGPPPYRYLPEMPPKFLAVPTEPVHPQGRTGPVELPRGNVERPYGPVVRITGRD